MSGGPAARWTQVNEETEKKGLTGGIGGAPDVGIGGFVLGGGAGAFTTFYELACDQARDFEVR